MAPLKDIEQAAAWLGIPAETLKKRVAAREVPHTRIGKHVRFAEHHLAAIVEAGEQPMTTTPPLLSLVHRGHPPAGPQTPPPPPAPPRPDRRVS